jgi:hypothetical protein
MKKIIYITGFLLFIGCVSKKNNIKKAVELKSKETTVENILSNEEKLVMNDFLEAELSKEKYKIYKNLQPLVIKEAISKDFPLKIYSYCYDDRNSKIRTASNKEWILDSIEIKKTQDTLQNKQYFWKSADFVFLKPDTIDAETIYKSAKHYEDYIKYNNNIMFYLSAPLIFKKNYALVYYRCFLGGFGYKTYDMFTVLMKKNEKGKWEVDSYYYDPNSSW